MKQIIPAGALLPGRLIVVSAVAPMKHQATPIATGPGTIPGPEIPSQISFGTFFGQLQEERLSSGRASHASPYRIPVSNANLAYNPPSLDACNNNRPPYFRRRCGRRGGQKNTPSMPYTEKLATAGDGHQCRL